MVQVEKISKAEAVKQQSRRLRGHIGRDLADTANPFDGEGYSLLKFHGIYQGYDRDSATELKQAGNSKHYQLMVRVRIPGGRLKAAQYLALDKIAGDYANDTLRVTTRQSIQFHGVVKKDLKAAMGEISAGLMTTLAACGDVVRTVTTTPAPIRNKIYDRLEADARLLGTALLPQTGAYKEIWVDGTPWSEEQGSQEPVDPLYGDRYLPRKFKIGFAVPEDNTIDVLTNDLGIVALWENGELVGYNFFVGGGHGMTHNKPETYPRMASAVAFVEPDDLVEAAKAVVRLHRDYGDRGNRRHARIKYVIAERGEEWARERLSEYLGKTLEPARTMADFAVADHLGWHEQGDGTFSRPADFERPHRRRREIATAHRDPRNRRRIRRRPDPDAEPGHHPVRDRPGRPRRDHPQAAPTWRALCRGHGAGRALGAGLPGAADLRPGADRGRAGERRPGRRNRRAAGALRAGAGAAQHPHHRLPQRLRPALFGRYRHCRAHPRLLFDLCRRRFRGQAPLNEEVANRIRLDEVADVLEPLFALFGEARESGEGFGDFCHRYGVADLREVVLASRGKVKDAAD